MGVLFIHYDIMLLQIHNKQLNCHKVWAFFIPVVSLIHSLTPPVTIARPRPCILCLHPVYLKVASEGKFLWPLVMPGSTNGHTA